MQAVELLVVQTLPDTSSRYNTKRIYPNTLGNLSPNFVMPSKAGLKDTEVVVVASNDLLANRKPGTKAA